MYTSIWNKYLPVFKIILKRALVSDQVLKLDATDFEKVGTTRKANTRFSIQSTNGKFQNAIKHHEAAKDLVSVLMQDEVLKELLVQNDYSLTLTTKYELTIRFVPRLVAEEVATES